MVLTGLSTASPGLSLSSSEIFIVPNSNNQWFATPTLVGVRGVLFFGDSCPCLDVT